MEDECCHDTEQVKRIAVNDFTTLFADTNAEDQNMYNGPRIFPLFKEEKKDQLAIEFTLKEIYEALIEMRPLKAPELHDFHALFCYRIEMLLEMR